jgi:hypothetical protein
MVIVKLQGGLGNQMFQYACGRALALRTGAELRLDLHFLLDRRPRPGFVYRNYELNAFRIVQSFASTRDIARAGYGLAERIKARLGRRPARWTRRRFEHLCEPVDRELLTLKPPVYLDGNWQSPAYFHDAQATIRDEFTLWHPPTGEAEELRQRIWACPSVCLHVRRGDFVGSQVTGTCSLGYYDAAIQFIQAGVSDPSFFVFSDDIPWCRQHLQVPTGTVFVDPTAAAGNTHWEQHLMQNCCHFILPNSTFSWWAAYLSDSAKKIVVLS